MQKNGPRVFVTQIPNRREGGAMVPSFDVMPAAEHGEITVLLPASSSIFATGDMITQLRNQLVDYNFLRGDSIVPAGDPAIIFAVGAILMHHGYSRYRMLKWEKNLSRYVAVEIVINGL